MHRKIALAALLLILAVINWSIYQKEQLLSHGRVVFLELAPIDPRSLMQGDYMALSFQLERDIYSALPKQENGHWRRDVDAADGLVVVNLDQRQVATYAGLFNGQTLQPNQVLMRYRVRNGSVKFATNGFFFQEGHADYYDDARFGAFRVDQDGELLLTALYSPTLHALGPDTGPTPSISAP